MSYFQPINPSELGFPKGYSNGLLAPAGGRLLFISGQIAWNAEQQIVSESFAAQFTQALRNILSVVKATGGGPEHIGRLTIYVTDKKLYEADLKGVGLGYREVMGKNFPTMALLEVRGLLEPGALVEIEATAVVP